MDKLMDKLVFLVSDLALINGAEQRAVQGTVWTTYLTENNKQTQAGIDAGKQYNEDAKDLNERNRAAKEKAKKEGKDEDEVELEEMVAPHVVVWTAWAEACCEAEGDDGQKWKEYYAENIMGRRMQGLWRLMWRALGVLREFCRPHLSQPCYLRESRPPPPPIRCRRSRGRRGRCIASS